MKAASDRIKWLRQVIGYNQAEMAELLGVDFFRYKNIEQKKARVTEGEFEPLCRKFKGLIHFLVYGGVISLDELLESKEPLERMLAAAIESGRGLDSLPEGLLKHATNNPED